MVAPALPVLMTAVSVGLWLSLPTRRVERMAREGVIPAVLLPTGEVLFDRAELLTWLERLRFGGKEVAHAS